MFLELQPSKGWSFIGSRGKAHFFERGKYGMQVYFFFSKCEKYSMSRLINTTNPKDDLMCKQCSNVLAKTEL